jgi:hypothetical protein
MHRIDMTGLPPRAARAPARPLPGWERITAAALAVVALALAATHLRELGLHDVAFIGVTVVEFGLLALGARWVLRTARTRQGFALSAFAALVAAGYLNNDVLDAPPHVFQGAGWALVAVLATVLSVGRRAA